MTFTSSENPLRPSNLFVGYRSCSGRVSAYWFPTHAPPTTVIEVDIFLMLKKPLSEWTAYAKNHPRSDKI